MRKNMAVEDRRPCSLSAAPHLKLTLPTLPPTRAPERASTDRLQHLAHDTDRLDLRGLRAHEVMHR